jgi:hypothetical protein
MGNLGVVAAVGIGVIVSLSAPVLVWAMVVAGLRRSIRANAPAERESKLRSSKAGA